MASWLPFIAASFFVTAGLCRYLISASHQFRWLSTPRRGRDVHTTPTPRIGGLAMALGTIPVALLALHFLLPEYRFSSQMIYGFDRTLLFFCTGLLVIVIGMLIDDLKGLPVAVKFVIQLLGIFLLLLAPLQIPYLNNPFGNIVFFSSIRLFGVPIVASLVAALWLLLLMNAINLIDGLDGLAGGVSMIALVVLAVLSMRPEVTQPQTALFALIAAGSVLGFLIFNWSPARLFMGDAGSHFLGLLIGGLAIIIGGKVATTALVLGIPLFDLLIVTGRRLIQGKNPFTSPGKDHLHHRFLAAGFSSQTTVIGLLGISLLFGITAVLSNGLGKFRAFGVLALVIFFVLLITRPKADSS